MINEEWQTHLKLRQLKLKHKQSLLLDIQANWKKRLSLLQSCQPTTQLDANFIHNSNKDLLALSNINRQKFWKILEPVLQEQTTYIPNQPPMISILTPTFNSSLDWFIETVLSVLNQSISNWEWCLVDDGSTKGEIQDILRELANKHPRIKVVLQKSGGISTATNKALEIAIADYVCFLDHDDTLAPTALEESLKKLLEGFDVTYSDEDKIDTSGLHYIEPFFKPDWSPEYFRGVMYIGHFLCVRKELATKVGGFNSLYDGVQDYEFMLRLSEATHLIAHIPRILYHWRKISGSVSQSTDAKPAVSLLQEKAVNNHLKRIQLSAKARQLGNHRICIIPINKPYYPLISIVIPTKNTPEHLERCLKSLFTLSTYPNFEVILVDNETTDKQALELMKQYPVKRLHFSDPFNYSRANNLGVEYADGDYLVFLNNDTEVLNKDWLQHLLYYAEQPDVGAVGALLLFPNKTVQHAGVVLGIRGTADHLMRGFPGNIDGYAGSLVCAREVSAVTAACMMMRKTVFTEIGGFNEHFFTHYQDVDLCLRIRKQQKRILFTPRAVLIHYESMSRKEYYDLIDRNFLLDQWQIDIEQGDPFYNPNFSIQHYDYTIKNSLN